jgi:hypothetical protein
MTEKIKNNPKLKHQPNSISFFTEDGKCLGSYPLLINRLDHTQRLELANYFDVCDSWRHYSLGQFRQGMKRDWDGKNPEKAWYYIGENGKLYQSTTK